jgi:DNA-binding transcriptional regulator YdaS (Cro superfamily)
MDAASRVAAHNAFRLAVDRIGSQSEFERQTGAKQQKVSYWLRKKMLLPAEYVLPAERATGISRHDLRPDLYPREDAPPPHVPAILDDAADGPCDRRARLQVGEPVR